MFVVADSDFFRGDVRHVFLGHSASGNDQQSDCAAEQ
jgi:hypothetical protein